MNPLAVAFPRSIIAVGAAHLRAVLVLVAEDFGRPMKLPISQVLLFAGLLVAMPSQAAVDFNRDILPLLSDNCFACHGPDKGKRKAKLRLDIREGATPTWAVTLPLFRATPRRANWSGAFSPPILTR